MLHPDDAQFMEKVMLVVGGLVIAVFVALGDFWMAGSTAALFIVIALGWRLLRRHSLL